MTTDRKVMQMALEALDAYSWEQVDAARTALRARLAEPEPEPVAHIHRQGNHYEVSERFLLDDEKARGWTEEPLYTAPPTRRPLTPVQEAAPELLEALHDALHLIETISPVEGDTVRKCRAAIAKAEGGNDE